MNAPRVLILGAGPGGLSAALSLHRAGIEVGVVEKAPFVGGLTRTVVRDGFRFDLGGHRFYTKNRSVFEFVAGLLGDDLLSVPRLSRIHFRGRFVDYPIKPLNATTKKTIAAAMMTPLREILDRVRAPVMPGSPPD